MFMSITSAQSIGNKLAELQYVMYHDAYDFYYRMLRAICCQPVYDYDCICTSIILCFNRLRLTQVHLENDR